MLVLGLGLWLWRWLLLERVNDGWLRNFASMLVLRYTWVRIRILVERTINGWFLEWRVVRYSDLFVYRVYVRWTVVDDQR